MAGLAPDKCREWKTGGICYIEDFSKPARQGDGPSSQPLAAAMPQTQAPSKGEQAQTVPPLAARANSDYEVCRSLNPENLGRPTIEIADVKKAGGGFFSDSYRISGTIEGNCLIEAGVFESGKKIEDIPISTAREFRRFNFEVKAGARQGREIRAYNINGQRDSFVFSGPQ